MTQATIIKKATEIKRNEWVTYCWLEVTTHCSELTYIRGRQRPIEESIRAGQEFDEWFKNARRTFHKQPDTGESGHKI